MRKSGISTAFVLTICLVAGVLPVWAQQMPSHAAHGQPGATPTLAGQDAFGAIQEIVRILEADPATDWSKVNLERLRQHLIDMNEVTLRAGVKAERIPGGLRMDITGLGGPSRRSGIWWVRIPKS